MQPDSKKKERTLLASQLLDAAMKTMLESLTRQPCPTCGCRSTSASEVQNVLSFLKQNGFSVDQEAHEDALEQIMRDRKEREATQGPLLPN